MKTIITQAIAFLIALFGFYCQAVFLNSFKGILKEKWWIKLIFIVIMIAATMMVYSPVFKYWNSIVREWLK